MLTENHLPRTSVGYEMPTIKRTRKTNIQVGGAYWCKIEGYTDVVKAECVKVYYNSAMVKIIVCRNEKDDLKQRKRNDVAIVRLKNMEPAE